ncbi:MAG: hypothetical protein JKY88_00785 [Pseudomonadales bacterium]|nr:hypothetical protein [Pseudomonadales bacterium]
MRLSRLSTIVLATQILVSQGVFAQSEEISQDQIENSVPKKVYVQTAPSRNISRDNSRNISREGENCFYNDEHQHIHCYEDVRYEDQRYENKNFNKTKSRVVYRTSNRTYRDRGYSPSALSIGLAIGIPLLIHNSYRNNSYRHGYRSHQRHHRSHYRRHHRGHYSHYRSHH